MVAYKKPMAANFMEVYEALRTNLIKVPYCLGEEDITPSSGKNSCQPEKCRNSTNNKGQGF